MAEPLKNRFGPDIAQSVANLMARAYSGFDQETYLAGALIRQDDRRASTVRLSRADQNRTTPCEDGR